MTSGVPGSAYEPHPDTAVRLERWRRLAAQGVPVDDIAESLGVRRAALDRMVCRARANGHPHAIRHANATEPGTGTWHLTGRDRRGHRRGGGTIQEGSP